MIRKELEIKTIWTTMWEQHSEDGVHQPNTQAPSQSCILPGLCGDFTSTETLPLLPLSQREHFSLIHSGIHFLGISTVKPRWAQFSQLTLRDWGVTCSSKQQTNWKKLTLNCLSSHSAHGAINVIKAGPWAPYIHMHRLSLTLFVSTQQGPVSFRKTPELYIV